MPLYTHLIGSIHCQQEAHPLLSSLGRMTSLSEWTQLTARGTPPLTLLRLLCRQQTALRACLAIAQLLAA